MNAQKCALIVDDSRTAREALGRVLEQHDVRVEMAESAEQALDALRASRPDVIFMDHLMPGMDGFEAVRAIKENPATATIPIMMYTSQAGELYVGQARALGAVGVLPKQIKPVQVSETLLSLNLLQREAEQADVVAREAPREPVDVERSLADVEDMMEPADWGDLHLWFEQMLEHHGHNLRHDIETSVARLLRERDDEIEQTGEHLRPGFFARGIDRFRRMNATTLLIAGLAMFSATFFWMYVETQKDARAVHELNVDLLAALQVLQARASTGGIDGPGARPTSLRNELLAGFLPELEWSANQYASYGAMEIPLGDDRLDLVEGLVQQLRTVGFLGEIQIDSHVGDFCYVSGSDGNLEFAPPDMPVAECDRVGLEPAEARERSAKQSVAFANYLAALGQNEDQNIRIRVNARGNSSPLYSYPARSAGSNAGDWNRIAQQNNRVQVRLLASAEGPTPSTSSAPGR
jgi:CheY-like chemotaxis protein